MNKAAFKFITGQAGTGKSTLARKMAAEDSGVLLTASTGIAAINLGDCRTINSVLGYFDTKSLRECYSDGSLDGKIAKLSERMNVNQIIVDEASMLSGDQLDLICRALDFYNKSSSNPIGLTLVADMCQLAPIKAPFIFEGEEWSRFESNTTRLTKVYRQSDSNFIEALNAARRGDGAEAAEYFRGHFHNTVDTEYDGTTIVGTNKEVDRLNAYSLSRLPGRSIQFPTVRTGKGVSEWKNIPESLEVKVGALVMLLSNKYTGGYNSMSDTSEQWLIYANGDLGHFVGKQGDEALVELLRNGEIERIGYIQRNNDVVNKKGLKVTKGTIRYLPLRVAYASTTYKAQGLTMDACQINIRHPFFSRIPGMVYVALSRCRSSEGIRLVGNENLLIKRCNVDPKVLPWL